MWIGDIFKLLTSMGSRRSRVSFLDYIRERWVVKDPSGVEAVRKMPIITWVIEIILLVFILIEVVYVPVLVGLLLYKLMGHLDLVSLDNVITSYKNDNVNK